ncbi:hypothetical protein E5F05_04395 (plasmid) [Deinococcus metallilatus]|uniref:Uncharacterized protein n=1 Tax=Deinococcus metallilatus TaxID=1211322 RepID=A0AAJ5JZ61_9DEIO|nr:hypothetical protein [Deinococcus metallilatus]MBB5293818.1 hypothetical protein [Deinococcus metallilatus]QBY07227.1 hypothetical protein E5F05_04395 [Deinococcus metallilatus]RXJ14699.1 hypothetical protein ERJ73_03125 [Deinococcus metallilatus]TLK30819.1 hypothetical protein FCS05_03440 [Deinococcus metallilatus]GMA17749.1 hypothetical protein GCM10025871_40800 [Deinococcus metallilatus]
MRLSVLPRVASAPPAGQALLTHTLDLLDLLDVLRPNLERTLCVDLMITCPAVSAQTTCELARLALQEADGLPAHPQLPQLPALTAHVRRLLGALLASPAPHGLVA